MAMDLNCWKSRKERLGTRVEEGGEKNDLRATKQNRWGKRRGSERNLCNAWGVKKDLNERSMEELVPRNETKSVWLREARANIHRLHWPIATGKQVQARVRQGLKKFG
ncbi:hypothetical protein TWF569_002191 [Orbilia oligospora]|uniref:Uncharacterized protein n=1 Tax=Orbilia oligospora TaxID=2813651 RepID=A0A7C8JQ06_ORBOL|nr:hypothetical protein TWF103_002138 [Orbilia oligospora]KAF3087531.1 hypothetical protein TWF706_011162 [Orbilia oligospora]KAF3087977.1 hypothetical protein TWF102_010352 [Orbilia oligospora]KAF3122354.1 hypothetical protein TWF569_002191 [Orbilia oligospora]KAF3125603.1 hypothetical protein TWF703_010931 [Orbilia oligospora]